MTTREERKRGFENLSFKATQWIGTTWSLVAHTILFILAFLLPFFGIEFDKILLVLTTIVSLEAIYLAIFIQMTVNRNNESLEEVEESLDEVEKDIDEIQEDVDEISKDIDEIQEDVDEISKDIDEIQEDVDEDKTEEFTKTTLEKIEQGVKQLSIEIEKLKSRSK